MTREFCFYEISSWAITKSISLIARSWCVYNACDIAFSWRTYRGFLDRWIYRWIGKRDYYARRPYLRSILGAVVTPLIDWRNPHGHVTSHVQVHATTVGQRVLLFRRYLKNEMRKSVKESLLVASSPRGGEGGDTDARAEIDTLWVTSTVWLIMICVCLLCLLSIALRMSMRHCILSGEHIHDKHSVMINKMLRFFCDDVEQ